MSNLAPLLSSARTNYLSPPVVLDRVRAVAPIELDPCGHQDSLVGARHQFRLTLGEDGLERDWGDGLIYCNPPYGRALRAWSAAIARAAASGAEIISLVPARTDTRWWRTIIAETDLVCFWSGRLTFVGEPDPAPFPSAILYSGIHARLFVQAFGDAGWLTVGARRLSVGVRV